MSVFISGQGLSDTLVQVWEKIVETGEDISPRGIPTKEIYLMHINIRNPHDRFVNIPTVNYPLIMVKQMLSILDMEDQQAVEFYEKDVENPSAAYIFNDIYYGRISRKMSEIYFSLKGDENSRQAVINIDKDPSHNLICPITIGMQFLVRNKKLNMVVFMRSNEMWKGFATDIQFFALLQEILASWLHVSLGSYTHIVSSAHLYNYNIELVSHLIATGAVPTLDNIPEQFNLDFEQTKSYAKEFLKFEKELRCGKICCSNYLNQDYLSWSKNLLSTFYKNR